MNILFISRCPPYPPHLGDRLILWHLARELHAAGHTLDILAFSQFESDPEDIPQYAAYFRHIKLIAESPRSPLNYVGRLLLAGKRFPHTSAQAWSEAMWESISEVVGQNQYDVVHVFGGVQVYEFYRAIEHLPAIIVPYESYSLYLKRLLSQKTGLKTQIMQLIAAQFERWMFSPYQRTVVLAEPDRAELLRLNCDLDVDIISNGIDLTYFDPVQFKTERDPATLLFVGNYEYAPNIDAAKLLAKEIFPMVQDKYLNAKLILAGKAPPQELQGLANDAITITGWVDDLRPYYAKATLFVCPLQIGAGMKNKVLEALAMNLPVVATSLSADGILVEHEHSAIVAPVPAMAAWINALLIDKGHRNSLAKTGRKLIEKHYSWSGVAEQYVRLYQEVIKP